jgi:hypothetical protein
MSVRRDVIYDNPDIPPPSANLGTAQLVADPKKRTVGKNSSDVVTLEFENNASTTSGNYAGTFTFGSGTGCSVSFGGSNANACVLGYPFASSNPRTSVIFNESEVLQAFDPAVATSINDTVRLYAADEHAMLLGVRTAAFPVSTLPSNPGHVANPLVGDKTITDPSGRPIFPSIYLTDVTGITDTSTSNLAYRAGDWQYGGTPIAPAMSSGRGRGRR